MGSVTVAITGASGARYGVKLTAELLARGLDVDLIVSPTGLLLLEDELGLTVEAKDQAASIAAYIKAAYPELESKDGATLNYYANDNIAAPPASGSALKRQMIVCPCSMGTLGRIASGVSHNLIDRAADCVLKERGTLVLVPRETPLNDIHLENMLRVSRAGGVILPAMPAFYHRPETIDDMVDFIVGKTLDMLGIENELYKRWS